MSGVSRILECWRLRAAELPMSVDLTLITMIRGDFARAEGLTMLRKVV